MLVIHVLENSCYMFKLLTMDSGLVTVLLNITNNLLQSLFFWNSCQIQYFQSHKNVRWFALIWSLTTKFFFCFVTYYLFFSYDYEETDGLVLWWLPELKLGMLCKKWIRTIKNAIKTTERIWSSSVNYYDCSHPMYALAQQWNKMLNWAVTADLSM